MSHESIKTVSSATTYNLRFYLIFNWKNIENYKLHNARSVWNLNRVPNRLETSISQCLQYDTVQHLKYVSISYNSRFSYIMWFISIELKKSSYEDAVSWFT